MQCWLKSSHISFCHYRKNKELLSNVNRKHTFSEKLFYHQNRILMIYHKNCYFIINRITEKPFQININGYKQNLKLSHKNINYTLNNTLMQSVFNVFHDTFFFLHYNISLNVVTSTAHEKHLLRRPE